MVTAAGPGSPHHSRVKTTRYFREQILRKRPYLQLEWIDAILRAPAHREVQSDGRVRLWGYIPALARWLRVITLEDNETVHNAFPDRTFKEPRP
jgi:hypothetical protein